MKKTIDIRSVRFVPSFSTATRTIRTKKDKANTRSRLKLRLKQEGW